MKPANLRKSLRHGDVNAAVDGNDRALSDLCARIFQQPSRIVAANQIRMPLIQQAVHAHDDLLQLDLAIGYAGQWFSAAEPIEVDGATAAVFYPRTRHGYALKARRHDAELFSIKVRVSPRWPAVKQQIFPAIVRGIAGAQSLAQPLRKLCRILETNGHQRALSAAALAQVLCSWPNAQHPPIGFNSGEARELDAVLAMLDERLSRPPSIEEMAACARMSSRHLTRRMRATLGCSPHDYLTARRISRARELLAHSDLKVTAVADALGFLSVHTFSRWFKREAGVNPRAFREKPILL